MTLEQLRAAGLPYEFLAYQSIYPSDKVTIKVVFPAGYVPVREKVHVWYGISREQHPTEAKRIEGANGAFSAAFDEKGRKCLTLTVDYPLSALIYVITWQPPS